MAEGSRKLQRKAKVGLLREEKTAISIIRHEQILCLNKQTKKGLFRTQALLKMKDLRAEELQNGQKLEDKVEQFLKQHKDRDLEKRRWKIIRGSIERRFLHLISRRWRWGKLFSHFKFLLKYRWFTMPCQFQVFSYMCMCACVFYISYILHYRLLQDMSISSLC